MGNLQRFLRFETLGGLALAVATVLAMFMANGPWAGTYQELIHLHGEVRLGEARLEQTLLHWINDGLMAVFFLLIGLELRREIVEGELADWRKAVLPLIGAVGGMAVPCGIYAAINAGDPVALRGWAIPAATDIAFALGVLSLLGPRVPAGLKAFLLSLAVFDDLGAILIIAVVYTEDLTMPGQGLAFGAIGAMLIMRRLRVARIGPYLIAGAVLWVLVLRSGVHATVAGVITGVCIPLRAADEQGRSPARLLEHMLHPYVALVILPVFAFANAGVDLSGVTLESFFEPVTAGIVLGLSGGKLVGVAGSCLLAVRLGWARMPEGVRLRPFVGTCALAGIGFTMSLFLGNLAFERAPGDFVVMTRLGVLGGTLLSALLGLALLLPGSQRE